MKWPWQRNPRDPVAKRTLWGTAANPRYQQMRDLIRQHFAAASLGEVLEEHVSPTARFRLEVRTCPTGPNRWNYTRGEVTRLTDNRLLSVVERNYSAFWHCWVLHPDGHEYLLCGEDYQGYSVINLTAEQEHVYLSEAGIKGSGFCWAEILPSPDRLALAVSGCIWGGPFDGLIFDFSQPHELPLPEIARLNDIDALERWKDDEVLVCSRESYLRPEDDRELGPDEVEIEEERDPSGIRTIRRILELKRPRG